MRTIDISITNAPLPYGTGVEVIARRKDCNLPSVVMDWEANHLWIDATVYDTAQILQLGKVLHAAVVAGAPRFSRAHGLEQLRQDLRGI